MIAAAISRILEAPIDALPAGEAQSGAVRDFRVPVSECHGICGAPVNRRGAAAAVFPR